MGIALPQLAPASEDRASGAQVIDGSLKFQEDPVNTHLKRTFVTGNKRTWTWSAWIKNSFSGDRGLFSASTDASNRNGFTLQDENKLLFDYEVGGTRYLTRTDAVYRDDSQFYHFVLAIDTTQSTESNRVRIYVNGTEQSLTEVVSGYPSENAGMFVNSNIEHYIGRQSWDSSAEFGGYMAQVYFIDGQQLGPDSFGFTDPLTNTWRPKKFSGRFVTGQDFGLEASDIVSTTGFQGGEGADKVIDSGDFNANRAHTTAGNAGETLTVTFSPAVTVSESLKVFAYLTVSGDNEERRIRVNGGSWFNPSSTADTLHDLSFTGSLSTIQIEYNGSVNSRSMTMRGIVIDGDPVVVSGGETGENSFYLPMDGNSPIGDDQSGKGNDFTPVNFGGSNSLEKATGALPILNTTQGGTQAGVGVFGSRESAFYTATGSSGSGSGYVFDGVSGNNPSFSFIRGATYTFDYSAASGHPIRFSSTDPDSSTTAYTTGTNTATSNVIKFTVPHDAPDNLWYYCTNHSNMNGAITVTTDNTKADQYASNCVLGLPLITSANDVSTSIGCTSTTKTTAVTNAVASNNASNFYSGSYYFDGSGDYINVTAQSELSLQGDFTIECWTLIDTNVSNGKQISSLGYYVSGKDGNWYFGLSSSAGYEIVFYSYDGQSNAEFVNADLEAPSVDKWYHIAAVRIGTTVTLYVDGVSKASGTISKGLDNGGVDGLTLGRISQSGGSGAYGTLNGYIQDLRIYNGVGKYTSNFIPAATSPDILPDTPSGVSGGSKLTKITDGAVSFDGTGDYLTIADSADFELGSGDFTIEFFAYPKSLSSDSTVISKYSSGNRSYLVWMNSTTVNFTYSTNGSSNAASLSVTYSVPLNKWTYFAMVRDGSTLNMFIDGLLVASPSISGTLYDGSFNLQIGRQEDSTPYYWNGFISNARIIKGTALYTSNFTPSTAPLTNVTNTKLLCCQSPTSATAAAVTPGSITANGNASATNFNPFNTDINTVRGQESGYATFNPTYHSDLTLSDGNLKITRPSGSDRAILAAPGVSSGKYYWETTINLISYHYIGVGESDLPADKYPGQASYPSAAIEIFGNGRIDVYNGTIATGGNTEGNQGGTTGMGSGTLSGTPTIGVAFDMDNKTLSYYNNGVLLPILTKTITSTKTLFPAHGIYTAGEGNEAVYNFGQKPFKFPPPAGFQPLNAANIRPETVIARPDQFVDVITYVGDDATTHAISGLKFDAKPDLVWIKNRDQDEVQLWKDTVRGVDSAIYSSSTAGADTGSTYSDRFPSFDFNGFTVGSSHSGSNSDGDDFVAWCWRAGGDAGTFNKDGVAYANASGVNMGAGDLNSSAYNTSETWSTASDANAKAFDGSKAYDSGANRLYGSSTLHTAIDAATTFTNVTSVIVGVSENSGNITIDGTAYSTTYASALGLTVTNPPNTVKKIEVLGSSGGLQISYVMINGVVLVDNGVTPSTNIPSIAPLSASIGTKQGFSIVRHEANNSANQSVAHGLTQRPDFSIFKNIDSTYNWVVYHKDITTDTNKVIYLNTTATPADYSGSNRWWYYLPDDRVFYVGDTGTALNNSTDDMISYHWHSVPGLQKFGSYLGTGAVPNYVHLGFRPALVIIKNAGTNGSPTNTNNWLIQDSTRFTSNQINGTLYPNRTDIEATEATNFGVDFLSDGFALRTTSGYTTNSNNASEGHTFIYAAWAEAPSINLYGGQSNAR